MIPSDTLNPLLNSAFTGKITWYAASNEYSLDEFIDTFYNTRNRVVELLDDMTDAQMSFSSVVHSLWSISESVTHLIYSQGYYINKLLAITTSSVPHIVEAARGFGEGARFGVPAYELRSRMNFATEQVTVAIENTRNQHDSEKTEVNEFFGVCNYQTWILLLLAHEVDHLKQIVAMRRLARTEGGRKSGPARSLGNFRGKS